MHEQLVSISRYSHCFASIIDFSLIQNLFSFFIAPVSESHRKFKLLCENMNGAVYFDKQGFSRLVLVTEIWDPMRFDFG